MGTSETVLRQSCWSWARRYGFVIQFRYLNYADEFPAFDHPKVLDTSRHGMFADSSSSRRIHGSRTDDSPGYDASVHPASLVAVRPFLLRHRQTASSPH